MGRRGGSGRRPAGLELARWAAGAAALACGPLGWLVPGLERDGVPMVLASAADVLTAAAGFAVAVTNATVAHQRDPRLDEAVEAAVRSPAGGSAGCRSDLAAAVDMAGQLIAASLGVWAVLTAPVVPVPGIWRSWPSIISGMGHQPEWAGRHFPRRDWPGDH